MGCLAAKPKKNPKEDTKKKPETKVPEPLAIVPPTEKASNFNVVYVRSDGQSEPYVPRAKPLPKQFDKAAHLTLSIESLRSAPIKISGTPSLKVPKLYEQVRIQMSSSTKEFMLIYNGKELTGEEKAISDFDIISDATLDLVYAVQKK